MLFGFVRRCKIWKALVSGVHIEEYIEVTYNGDKQEVYVDVYQKVKNVRMQCELGR